ncbi:hypothetical protein L9F63_013178 [Diploptera punctata]|uniref:Kinetochore protein Spc24 n=1 Tax=Diploptera punctata TaxID=6984 RepID=A0AAD8AAP3_DIPPU|nr:hypothetical protein L9F63_013178 [Diploptera punctata]
MADDKLLTKEQELVKEMKEKISTLFDFENDEQNILKFNNFLKCREMITSKIKDSEQIINEMSKEIGSLQNCIQRLEEELKEKSSKSEKLLEKEATKRKEIKDLQEVAHGLEKEIEQIHEQSKPHEKDIEIINKNRKTLKAYKNMTGIKWNYAVSSRCQGVSYNNTNRHLKHISYPMEEAHKLWTDIEESGHASWSHITQD